MNMKGNFIEDADVSSGYPLASMLKRGEAYV